MEVQAITRSVHISPRKIRAIADAIRNQSLEQALITLSVLPKRGTVVMEKTIKSAVANAVNNAKLDQRSLTIARIEVNEGQALKRFHPSTRGRVHPYKKRSSMIRIVLTEKKKPVHKNEKTEIAIEKKVDVKKEEKNGSES